MRRDADEAADLKRFLDKRNPVFIVAGLIYFLAVIVIHGLTPRLTTVKTA